MYPIIVYTEIAAFFTDVYRTFQATVQRSIENETVIFRSTGNTDFPSSSFQILRPADVTFFRSKSLISLRKFLFACSTLIYETP